MPDTGNVAVVNRPVADVDPKLGQFAVSFTAIPQCPPGSHMRFYQGGHGCTGCRVCDKVYIRHTTVRAMSLL